MHISIINNLTTLLKIGAFGHSPISAQQNDGNEQKGEGVALEPMSQHKWRKLYKAAEALNVLGYVAMGCKETDVTQWGDAEGVSPLVFQREFPLTDASLFNHWSDKHLMEVREEEMNAPDTSEETLTLLDTIVANAHYIITTDVSVEGIISLGRMVRQNKDKINKEKLTSWLSHIGLVQIANLEANMLTQCWDFAPEEIPFYTKKYKKAKSLHDNVIRKALESHSFSTATRLNVALTETASYNFMNAISKVTDIEE